MGQDTLLLHYRIAWERLAVVDLIWKVLSTTRLSRLSFATHGWSMENRRNLSVHNLDSLCVVGFVARS